MLEHVHSIHPKLIQGSTTFTTEVSINRTLAEAYVVLENSIGTWLNNQLIDELIKLLGNNKPVNVKIIDLTNLKIEAHAFIVKDKTFPNIIHSEFGATFNTTHHHVDNLILVVTDVEPERVITYSLKYLTTDNHLSVNASFKFNLIGAKIKAYKLEHD